MPWIWISGNVIDSFWPSPKMVGLPRQRASSGLQPSSRPFCSSCASWTNWSVSCSPSGPGNWSKWNQENPKRLEPRILERFGDFGVNTRGSSNTCEWMCPTVINSHSHQKENDSETSRIQRWFSPMILRNQPKLNPGHNFLHLRSLTSPWNDRLHNSNLTSSLSSDSLD